MKVSFNQHEDGSGQFIEMAPVEKILAVTVKEKGKILYLTSHTNVIKYVTKRNFIFHWHRFLEDVS